ncbi:hypothetical protein K445DRAFT_61587 [Daldinia sp. EC12]|nr:hypothetical protein K445DRAFT_61587 [Daldinia sp. EC12]
MPTPGSSSSGTSASTRLTPDEIDEYFKNVAILGPCSRIWNVPKRTRRRKKTNNGSEPTKRKIAKHGDRPKRGPLTDDLKRANTALTRTLRGCIRCRMNRIRCDPDLEDPNGPCQTCKRIKGKTLSKMPCYRYIITDASLYREQEAPYQLYSTRWQNMNIVDIDGWASDEIKTIVISQIFLDAPWTVKVREFVPVEGDLLEEKWESNGVIRTHPIPKYGLADMNQVAEMMQDWTDQNVFKYIEGSVSKLDDLFWETYMMAFRHPQKAKTEEEKVLIWDCFRLWIVCRLCSNPCHLFGEEKLGGQTVDDPNSPHYNRVPMPVMITAQMECILYTTILRPKSASLLKRLNTLVLAKKQEYWLTIYLVMFVLLHNCAMITKRDEETATQYGHRDRYANPASVHAQHTGVQAMLAHFHFINKGVIPFSLPHNEIGRAELQRAAELDDEQVDFVWRTSDLIRERVDLMKHVRERDLVGHDLFWVSFLYDEDWKPRLND